MFQLDRIMKKVVPAGDCWEWVGYKTKNGYGRVSCWGNGKTVNGQVHRVVYELMVTEIPPGLQLDHLCRRPSCCNPWHLEPVTPRVNCRRSQGHSGRNFRATECLHGHPFTADNTYMRPDGRGRQCRQCQRTNERRHKPRLNQVMS